MTMGINLSKALHDIRSKEGTARHNDVLEGFRALLKQPTEGERILKNLFSSVGNAESLNFDSLDADRIYHIDQIKSLCIAYRLRFLDSSLFNGTFPAEAIDAVKDFEAQQGKEIKGFKMIAPAGMFKLAEKDKDPLLMVPMGNNYYYLLAQWGNDLHAMRKVLVYPFRSFESIMRSPKDTGTIMHIRVIFFFWMVFATSAMTALYGMSRMKNFSVNLWKSRFLD